MSDKIFSESELTHLQSMMEANPVSPTDPEINRTARKIGNTDQVGSTVNTNTVSSRDLTDETIMEMPSQHRSAAGSGRNTNRNLSALARKLSMEKPRYFRPHDKASKAEERAEGEKLTAGMKATVYPPGKAKLKEEEEHLEEGRGRPPKPGSAAYKRKHGESSSETSDDTAHQGRDPRQHIQVVAGQAAAGRHIDFKHNNGSTSKITPAMGRRITSHLNGLKPAERQTAVNKMHDSSDGLKV